MYTCVFVAEAPRGKEGGRGGGAFSYTFGLLGCKLILHHLFAVCMLARSGQALCMPQVADLELAEQSKCAFWASNNVLSRRRDTGGALGDITALNLYKSTKVIGATSVTRMLCACSCKTRHHLLWVLLPGILQPALPS